MEIDSNIVLIGIFILAIITFLYNRTEKFEDIDYNKTINIQQETKQTEDIEKKENTTCNEKETNALNDKIVEYNKIYGGLYNHQINNCKNLNCNIDKDIMALNNIMLENNNKRDCLTCLDKDKPINLAEKLNSVIENEKNMIRNQQITKNNIEMFSSFNDLVYQNTSNTESPVDKMAEIRLSDNNTCGLNNYGRKVADIYDNLLANKQSDNIPYNMDNVSGFEKDENNTANW
jgi:hypothetical protein